MRLTDRPLVDGANFTLSFAPQAAVLLVPRDDDDLERLMLGRSPRFQALLERSRQSIKGGKGLTEKAFWDAVRERARARKDASLKARRNKRGT